VFAPGADPARITADALSNTLTAVSALTADPRALVAVANVPDITLLPEARFAALRDPSLVPLFAQVSGLIDRYNGALAAQLAAMPGGERVAVVDLNGIFEGIINDPGLTIDGHPVDTLLPGDGPSHLFVDVIHPGTVGSGFVANGFIDALNGRFGTSIDRLSEREVYATAITPEPAGVSLALAPALLLLLLLRRQRRKVG
jgi:MYXO-CTERM domain-containing protein